MAEYKSNYTGEQIDAAIGRANTALQEELEPAFNASASKGITNQDITNWNNKSDFSGSYNDLSDKPNLFSGNYNDLSNKPSIPSTTSDLTNDSGFIDNSTDSLTNYYKKSETYNKTEIDNKVSSVYKYKGTVSTYQDLPNQGLVVGDVYNVESDGSNYAWTGTLWDKLGGDIDLSGYQTKIDNSNKIDANLVDDANSTNKFVTSADKTSWTNKYDKPIAGIPKTDLAQAVQDSLDLADSAIQSNDLASVATTGDYDDLSNKPTIPDTSLFEVLSNKVTSISSSSTDDEYVSAKYLYENLLVIQGTVGTSSSVPLDFTDVRWRSPGIYYLASAQNDFYYKKVSNGIYSTERIQNFKPYLLLLRQDLVNKRTPDSSLYEVGILFGENSSGTLISYAINYKHQEGANKTIEIKTYNAAYNTRSDVELLKNVAQTFKGLKTFNTIPQQSNTTAPTLDTQFTNKKYVDDQITNAVGNINTILATLTTPSNGGNE